MADNIDHERIREILNDAEFGKVVSQAEDGLTRTVMAPGTPSEDRDKALTEFHALQKLLARLRSVAQGV